jgi:hypothetical protein
MTSIEQSIELLAKYNKRHNTPMYYIRFWDDGACGLVNSRNNDISVESFFSPAELHDWLIEQTEANE